MDTEPLSLSLTIFVWLKTSDVGLERKGISYQVLFNNGNPAIQSKEWKLQEALIYSSMSIKEWTVLKFFWWVIQPSRRNIMEIFLYSLVWPPFRTIDSLCLLDLVYYSVTFTVLHLLHTEVSFMSTVILVG